MFGFRSKREKEPGLTFPGDWDTTIMGTREQWLAPPEKHEPLPPIDWKQFAEDLEKTHEYINSPAGRELYAKVDALHRQDSEQLLGQLTLELDYEPDQNNKKDLSK